MATLHDMAVNMPLTYITATFDTVTTPDSLVHLFDEYFQYFTHKGHPEPQDAEQVRPILDLINTTALPSASTGDILQGGSENITAPRQYCRFAARSNPSRPIQVHTGT